MGATRKVPDALHSKSARIFTLLAVNAALVGALAVVVELIFGDWFTRFVPPDTAIVDRTLVYRQALYEPAGDVVYVRDKYGLRGVHEALAQVELVTVGGSTTDQRYITEGATWQAVLRARSSIRVANAGVDGMSSHGHLVAVSEWLFQIPALAPKHYLHLIGVNDASLSQNSPQFNKSGTSSILYRKLLRRSVIAKSMLRVWLLSRGPIDVSHGRLTVPLDSEAAQMVKVEIEGGDIDRFVEMYYKRNLRWLIELHRARGETAILVSQPARPSVVAWKDGETYVAPQFRAEERWALALSRINAATQSVCGENADNCRFLDLARKVRFEAAEFYDLVHATPAGARKIGAFLAQELGFVRGGS